MRALLLKLTCGPPERDAVSPSAAAKNGPFALRHTQLTLGFDSMAFQWRFS
jgi:hypothetical protein